MAAWQIPLSVGAPMQKLESQADIQKGQLGIQQLANATAIQRQVQQENTQKLADQQRAVKADQALAAALQQATKKGPDGKYTIDSGVVSDNLTKAGFGKEWLAVDKENNASLEQAAKTTTAKLEQSIKAGSLMDSAVGAIAPFPTGTPIPATDSSPATVTGPDPAKIAAYKASVTQAYQKIKDSGLGDPEHEQWLMQGLQNPTPEFDQQLRQYGAMGRSHAEQIGDLRNQANDAISNHLKQVETGEKKTEGVSKEVSLFGQTAPDNQEDWTKRRSTLSPEAQALIPANYSEANRKAARMGSVPTENQPKFTIENNTAEQMSKRTPEQWDAAVDEVSGDNVKLASRTKALVRSAIARGDWKTADAAIKDASDQIGRTETAVESAKATAPIKIEVATATDKARNAASGLTADDIQRAGQEYAITGVMPALGRDSIARGQILHAGQQWARDSGLTPRELIMAKASFQGDKKSLENFQKQRDQVVSFEQTAKKNLDLFLDAASKIPDSNIPWINAPLRTLTDRLVGSENMAAVNAARQVANNEIAKVTSGGGLSGVLSDSARKEVMEYNPRDATFAQTKAVANILKKDMANRHESMDGTINEIKGRIGTAGSPPAAAVAPSGKIIVTAPDGSTHPFDTQAQADVFKKLAHIQ